MIAIVSCLRNCFENDHDADEDHDEDDISNSRSSIIRVSSANSLVHVGGGLRGYYPSPTRGADVVCCETTPTSAPNAEEAVAFTQSTEIVPELNISVHDRHGGNHSCVEFFRMIGVGTERPYGAISGRESPLPPSPRQSSPGRVTGRSNSSSSNRGGITPESFPISSPLQEATTFQYISDSEIPVAIALDEVVLPGSKIQKEMALKMAAGLEKHGDECVICMEGFDPTNPRMPTLCGCGKNKTYFHLPCLYQWIEQDVNCPSCRKRLEWEEF